MYLLVRLLQVALNSFQHFYGFMIPLVFTRPLLYIDTQNHLIMIQNTSFPHFCLKQKHFDHL